MKATLDLSAIPHREPFLLVDEIEGVEENTIRTRKFVDPNSDFFRGHYPGNPVMPGVLICEACFQSGALLIAHVTGGYDATKGVPVLTRINDARFKQIVRPGQWLDIEATIDEELDGAYFLTARAKVGDKLAVRVAFACMLAGQESSP